MVDLHEGICTLCEKKVMVAACCSKHGIPVCYDCLAGLGEVGNECPVGKAAGWVDPGYVKVVTEEGKVIEGKNAIEQGFLSIPDGPPVIPDYELVGFTMGHITDRDTGRQAAIVTLGLGVDIQCPGIGDHLPHTDHMLQNIPMVIYEELIGPLIEALQHVKNGTLDQAHDEWVDKGIEGLLDGDSGQPD